ncbi:transposase, partial [Mobilicoccus sp.]|uniref:transposase n=1 Tax=Mobilicoccus sp. TaxID=2034349 RepID=UPI0028B1768F
MQLSHSVRAVFDEANLVSCAGLVPALALAEQAGWSEHLEGLSVPSPNAAAKATCVVAGMLAGADSIDDLDLLRHGGMTRLFKGVRAPSTLGTFLRSFTHGHVQQLDAAGANLLAGLARNLPALLTGGEPDGVVFLDVDDTIREVHGYAKQGASYGYSRVRGLNLQLATLSTPAAAPVIARARLRRGSVASATGAGRMLAQAITTAKAAGASGQLLCRADSAYYGWAFVGTALRHGAWFSVTARANASINRAITSIQESAWTPIRYPHAVWDEDEQRWISDAEVAEVPYVA